MLGKGCRDLNRLIQKFAEGNAVQRNSAELLQMAVHELAIQQPKSTKAETSGERNQSDL